MRQQLLELQQLREELATAQATTAALKRAAEGSKTVAKQQVSGLQGLSGADASA